MKLFYLPVLPLEHAHIKKKTNKAALACSHYVNRIFYKGFWTADKTIFL